jgi:hypothetical protein
MLILRKRRWSGMSTLLTVLLSEDSECGKCDLGHWSCEGFGSGWGFDLGNGVAWLGLFGGTICGRAVVVIGGNRYWW